MARASRFRRAKLGGSGDVSDLAWLMTRRNAPHRECDGVVTWPPTRLHPRPLDAALRATCGPRSASLSPRRLRGRPSFTLAPLVAGTFRERWKTSRCVGTTRGGGGRAPLSGSGGRAGSAPSLRAGGAEDQALGCSPAASRPALLEEGRDPDYPRAPCPRAGAQDWLRRRLVERDRARPALGLAHVYVYTRAWGSNSSRGDWRGAHDLRPASSRGSGDFSPPWNEGLTTTAPHHCPVRRVTFHRDACPRLVPCTVVRLPPPPPGVRGGPPLVYQLSTSDRTPCPRARAE